MNFDPATVSVDDGFGDRQSQASAGSLATRRVVDASEPIEDEWNLVFRNALPLIGNLYDKFASPGRRRKVYDPTRRPIFCRVVDQDHYRLLDPDGVEVEQSVTVQSSREIRPFSLNQDAASFSQFQKQWLSRNDLNIQRNRIRIGAGKKEQILNQLCHPRGFGHDLLQNLAMHRIWVDCKTGLGIAAEHCQRGA